MLKQFFGFSNQLQCKWLPNGISPLGIMNKLQQYKSLVTKYHQSLDLVSDLALEQFDSKLSDSLAYVEAIKEFLPEKGTIVDVGSGAGLPGIVLGVHLPHHNVILVERRQKRAAFLKIVASQLKLSNIRVFHTDVTDLKDVQADVISAMAVGSFRLLYCLTRHLHNQKVLLISKKGADYQVELEDLQHSTGLELEYIKTIPLKNYLSHIVSRETIYASLVAIRLLGGRECKKV